MPTPALIVTFTLLQYPDIEASGTLDDPTEQQLLAIHPTNAASTYTLTTRYTETTPGTVQLDMNVTRIDQRGRRGHREDKTVVSSPRLTTTVGEEAMLMVRNSAGDNFLVTVTWP